MAMSMAVVLPGIQYGVWGGGRQSEKKWKPTGLQPPIWSHLEELCHLHEKPSGYTIMFFFGRELQGTG